MKFVLLRVQPAPVCRPSFAVNHLWRLYEIGSSLFYLNQGQSRAS